MYIKLYGEIYFATEVEQLSTQALQDYASEAKTKEGKLKVIKKNGKLYVLCSVEGMGKEHLVQAIKDIIKQTDKELDDERMKSIKMPQKNIFDEINKQNPFQVPYYPNKDDMFKGDNRTPVVYCKDACTLPVTTVTSGCCQVLGEVTEDQVDLKRMYRENQKNSTTFLNKTIR